MCVVQAIGATFAAMIGAGMLVRTISYEHSPIPKHLAWMLHAGNNTVITLYKYKPITGLIREKVPDLRSLKVTFPVLMYMYNETN